MNDTILQEGIGIVVKKLEAQNYAIESVNLLTVDTIPPQCEVDEDCMNDLICRGQLCVLPKPCEDDSACNSRERCIDGNCEEIPSCGGDLNCAEDEICQDF